MYNDVDLQREPPVGVLAFALAESSVADISELHAGERHKIPNGAAYLFGANSA